MPFISRSSRPASLHVGVPLVLIAALSTLAEPSAQSPASPQKPPAVTGQPAPSADYIVGPSDVLAITVFNQEKLTNKYPVGADGTFVFPNLGRIPAGGLTVHAVEQDLRERLGKSLLRDPQVAVSVDQYRSQQIYVTGQVRVPQPLQFTGSMSLVEALTRAGSITERAGVEALIIRPPAGTPPDPATLEKAKTLTKAPDSNVIRVNLQALHDGDFSQNIPLRSGDIVSVLPAETVFVQGQVARPGEIQIRPGMTVQQVLALAGGITDRGSEGRIQIFRQVDGKKVTINVTTEDLVRGGDTINVRQRLL